jgi:hypothetical protein
MFSHRILAIVLLIALLTSCAPTGTVAPEPTSTPIQNTPTPTIAPSTTFTATITPTATPALANMDDFMKGMVYFPAGWGGDQRPEVEWILKNLVVPTGTNWIRLHIGCFQDGIRSTQVYCKPEEALSDEQYLYLVTTAHRLGLRVMSEHMIDSSGWSESWSGEIGTKYNEQQWADWFASYGEMILHYAALAESAGTDYIVIVSELDSTTHREKEWRDLVARVREVYHGKVSMAFDTERALEEVQFWDVLNAISVHPYFLDLPGVTDPTVEQLTQAFKDDVEKLEILSKKWNKPIIVTEIGYWSVHTASQDYNNLNVSNQIDIQEQADLFQAVVNAFEGKDWLEGIFWYAFTGSSNYAEPWNPHNDFLGKPAENVIRSFYGAPPMSTPTPVVFPSAAQPSREIIYDDRLNPPWNNYPPEGDPANVQFDQSEIAVSGNAIKANLFVFWALDFRNDDVDWNKYQWLDFDLYVQPKDRKAYTLGVSLRDTSYYASPLKLELLQSQFIEGGALQPGTWQHVRIPLDVFGPLLSKYGIISIDRPPAGRTNEPLSLYVDNVILSGK